MSQDWTEKYRPKTLADVVGNPKAVGELRAWADSWEKGTPKFRAVILMGSPGIGKTTSAEALAKDMGWGIVEMNASDQRTGDAIRDIAIRGSDFNTFTAEGDYLDVSAGGRKLIVLDEADSLFGNADRGAMPVIVELIRETKQPVMLIVNDFYALSKKSAAIKNETLQISFLKPSSISMTKIMKKIAASENVKITDEAVNQIVENANGDMRAAVRDLESLCLGKQEVRAADTQELSGRNVRKSMFDLMTAIFRRSDAMGARLLSRDIDEEPSFIMLWLDENMPYEFRDTGDLIRGYEKLSKADIFLGRVNRRQYYGMWSYATDTMTAGVCTARYTGNICRDRIRFPTYLSKMSRSKSVRTVKASLCQKLADHTHTSTKRVSMDVIPPLKLMLASDEELRVSLAREANLEAEEVAFLLDKKIDSKEVKAVMAAVKGEDEPATKTGRAKKSAVSETKPVEKKPIESVPEDKKGVKIEDFPPEKKPVKPLSRGQTTLF